MSIDTKVYEEQAAAFVRWLDARVLDAGRGTRFTSLRDSPGGKFWMGRLAPEAQVLRNGLGARGERLNPCAIGLRIRPKAPDTLAFRARVRAHVWTNRGTSTSGDWVKSPPVDLSLELSVASQSYETKSFGQREIAEALRQASGEGGHTARIDVETEIGSTGHRELVVQLVNATSEDSGVSDANLYEVSLAVEGLQVVPFLLDALPDVFRYDRAILAYGLNCGVVSRDGILETTDTVTVETSRHEFWWPERGNWNLRFEDLANDPLPELEALLSDLRTWGAGAWSSQALDQRSDSERWSQEMRGQASEEAKRFDEEVERLARGVEALRRNEALMKAFRCMNTAMSHASRGKFEGWRPFQLGFLVSNIEAVVGAPGEAEVTDTLWFPTGGGKTETYLGLLVVAALYDRIRGKVTGISAWSRFPLRMLSLQQTQRFANALAGAELVRRQERLGGAPFSLGFFVGRGGTPNVIRVEARPGEPDPDDPEMPHKYQVLLQCPFCHEDSVEMVFDRLVWRLAHTCTNRACPWGEDHLPFYVVDDEIYRFLPTVVVGTLDKAATVSFQAAMRGFVGSPSGVCTEEGHGHVYVPRGSTAPNGCRVPGCPGSVDDLPMEASLYPPAFRLQDELHLLRDSLGAIDSHYESLLDHLELSAAGRKPKILASSATLSGHDNQVETLYRRKGRVFPLQGPSEDGAFWSMKREEVARRFVAVAPRGVTIEFAIDRTLTELQAAIREAIKDPTLLRRELGFDDATQHRILSDYGTDVVYGNTLRDVEAVNRSLDTQIPIEPLNTTSLTGRTLFEDVRSTLDRLENPESEFADRLHVLTASSMMSHGVDIDRLNVMVVYGLPLTTAEFIQATARIGRRWPGLVYVMMKIGREREAGVFRAFEKFVTHGDRFIEEIPITAKSRNVLDRTLPGFLLARINQLHEHQVGSPLTTVRRLRDFAARGGFRAEEEVRAVMDALGLVEGRDDYLIEDVREWIRAFFRNLQDPAFVATFPSELCPGPAAMMSLRDVEESAPVRG